MPATAVNRLEEGRRLHALGDHAAAVRLLRLVAAETSDPAALHALALALGGQGERAMRLADQFAITPPPGKTAFIRMLFEEAISADPSLADVYWNMAVLSARFLRDFEAAAYFWEKARELGYIHPRMLQLAAMIENARSRPVAAPAIATAGADLMCTWLWELAVAPELPLEAGSDNAKRDDEPLVHARACLMRRVKTYLAAGSLTAADIAMAANRAARIDLGNGAFNVLEALCETAFATGQNEAIAPAATSLLAKLLQRSHRARAQANHDPAWLKEARRAADRGLAIYEQCAGSVDADLRAELLLARANTFSHPKQPNYAEAFRAFRAGVEAKQKLGLATDVAQLRTLLAPRIEEQSGRLLVATQVGLEELGATLEIAEEGYALARALDEPATIFFAASALADTYSGIGRAGEAEQIWRDVLARSDLSAVQRTVAEFQLGSTLAEQGRFAEALPLQERVALDQTARAALPEATLWANYGNTLRGLQRLTDAREAFLRGLEALGKDDAHGAQSDSRGHLAALLAEVEHALGNRDEARRWIAEAGRAYATQLEVPNLDRLQFHALAARLAADAGSSEALQQHIEQARRMLAWLLTRGPTLPVWENLLQKFAHLDDAGIRDALTLPPGAVGYEERVFDAFVTAEAAKGRMLAWLRRLAATKGAEAALDRRRHEEAASRLKQWADQRRGRRVVSFYAAARGLAIFSVAAGEAWRGRWISDFNYERFAAEVLVPWQEERERALAGASSAWTTANALTDYLCLRVGQWLWQAIPELALGGIELFIVPHRMLRVLPLTHARLPTGRSLSEVFEAVSIATTMAEVSESLDGAAAEPAMAAPPVIRALVDPDGSLPFARVEGFALAGPTGTRADAAATSAAFAEALAEADTVVLSAHGEFDELQPWHSRIHFSDGHLSLVRLIDRFTAQRTRLVVLGVCEAGRFRRSVSDEPLGFPALLQHAGVSAVLAPLWKVDDFASFIFLSLFFEHLRAGRHAAEAVHRAVERMQKLTAAQVQARLTALLADLAHHEDPGCDEACARVADRVAQINAWLDGLPPDSVPFRSPLDWAAFQLNANAPFTSV